MRSLLRIAVLAAFACASAYGQAPEEGDLDEAEIRQMSLEEVRERIQGEHAALTGTTREQWVLRDRLVYRDEQATAIHTELKALEKRILELRQKLQERLNESDEVKRLELRRSRHHRHLNLLRKREAALVDQLPEKPAPERAAPPS